MEKHFKERRIRFKQVLPFAVVPTVLLVTGAVSMSDNGSGLINAEVVEAPTIESETTRLEETTTTQVIATTTTTTTTTMTMTESTTTTAETIPVLNTESNVYITEDDLNMDFSLSSSWLTSQSGVYYWQSDDCGEIKESYYACSLSGVFNLFSEEIGYMYDSVAERSDGVWCVKVGESEKDWLVCVAANLESFPRGSLVRTSLGYGIVCDTGGFAYGPHGDRWFDIAVSSNQWGGTKEIFS